MGVPIVTTLYNYGDLGSPKFSDMVWLARGRPVVRWETGACEYIGTIYNVCICSIITCTMVSLFSSIFVYRHQSIGKFNHSGVH